MAKAIEVDWISVRDSLVQRRVSRLIRQNFSGEICGLSPIHRAVYERLDIGPLRLVLSKSCEGAGNCRPAAEAPLERAEVVFSFAAVGAARGRNSDSPGDFAPVPEQFMIFDGNGCATFESRGSKRGIPAREEAGDVVLGDSSEGDEFGTGRGSAEFSGDRSNGIRDLLPAGHDRGLV